MRRLETYNTNTKITSATIRNCPKNASGSCKGCFHFGARIGLNENISRPRKENRLFDVHFHLIRRDFHRRGCYSVRFQGEQLIVSLCADYRSDWRSALASTIERFADRVHQVLRLERLAQNRVYGQRFDIHLPRHDQNGRFRASFAEPADQFPAGHPRHAPVRQKQVDRPGVPLRNCHGVHAIRGFEDSESVAPENWRNQTADRFLIVGEQDCHRAAIFQEGEVLIGIAVSDHIDSGLPLRIIKLSKFWFPTAASTASTYTSPRFGFDARQQRLDIHGFPKDGVDACCDASFTRSEAVTRMIGILEAERIARQVASPSMPGIFQSNRTTSTAFACISLKA